MKKISLFVLGTLFLACTNYGQLKVLTDLPKKLSEVSATEKVVGSDLIWMLNDSGNKSEIYGVTEKGKIKKVIKVATENNDWEDLTSDDEGNIYIADFGNNSNERKDLTILKINHSDLTAKTTVVPEKITYNYPDQKKFPPKKKKRFFDAESLLYKNGYLYIFTKSRVKKHYGNTKLYRIPATKGNYTAKLLGSYENCHKMHCWITSAAISKDGKKVALLTHDKVLVFSKFTSDNFLNGEVKKYDLGHASQKEGLDFKNDSTLYITDERSHGQGRNLYEFSLN